MPDYLYELAIEDAQKSEGFASDLFKLVCIALIVGGFLFMAAAMIGAAS